MKNAKKLLLWVLALAMLLMAAGCGEKPVETTPTTTVPPTTEPKLDVATVVGNMLDATAEAPSVKTDTKLTMVMSMAIQSGGLSMNMEITMDMAMETAVSADPYAAYSCATMSMEMMGTTITEVTRSYTLEENGERVVYTHSETTDTWTREDAEDTDDNDYDFLSDKLPDDITLAEQTEQVSGREVYVLTTTITGDEISDLVPGMDDLTGSEMDFSVLSMPMEIYVDAETFLPIRTVTRLEGMSELMADALADSFGEGVGDAEADLSFGDVITNFTYENVTVPTLPEEALQNMAMAVHDPAQEDGSFIIIEQGSAAKITCPEGWEGSVDSFNAISVMDENYENLITYTMHPAMTRDELANMLVEENIQPMLDYFSEASYDFGSPIGDFEILVADYGGMWDYYAFAPMGEGWIVVNITIYEEGDTTDLLTQLLEMVEEVPFEDVFSAE